MPTTITLVNGAPAVEIEDARGKTWTYRLTHTRQGKMVLFFLDKLGSVHDERYTVTHVPGAWRCNCRSFFFRHSRGAIECKHIACTRDVAAFLGLGITEGAT